MKRSWLALILMTVAAVPVGAGEHVHHRLRIDLDPASQRLVVEDTVTMPEAGPLEFELNAALAIVAGGEGLEASHPESGPTRYRVTEIPPDRELRIRYEGTVDFALSEEKEQYTRGFRETAGIVGEDGLFLAGDTVWYPRFGSALVTFDLEVVVPDGWHVISQGTGTSRGDDGKARWSSPDPMDEIYLVGGPLRRYADSAGAVEALVYLRERDDALAGKYLAATAQYIEMYRGLIGPYPYDKFALVENFWETGYGMPSFTLLGSQVIRFPFILTSSYPHEILHNWWGNSVFVDYDSGNWSEGLTAYLADHLIKQQRGQGALHRRDTLQKYRNYVVQGGRDFPLAQFRSRHSAATEAVGYGKTLMVFHMLRQRTGDEDFRRALARFYRAQRGRRASWADVRASFEAITAEDLGAFFTRWVERAGAPSLALHVSAPRRQDDGGWSVTGSIEQTQEGEAFVLDVPLVLESETGSTSRHVVTMTGKHADFQIAAGVARPRRLVADPAFDVFRLLDPREIPPSIGQIFGEPEVLALLPSIAPAPARERYRELMEGWRSDSHVVEIARDVDLERLPEDRAIWILGAENVWGRMFAGNVERDVVVFGDERAPLAEHSVVSIRRHPDNLEKAVGWLVVDPPPAFAGMGRKLPHYGKYSYLAFEGEEPTNVIKGQWPTDDSPLVVDLRDPADRDRPLPPLDLPARVALAELPPVFSGKKLREHVERLSSAEYGGRGGGTEGEARAAEYVAGAFERIGLLPGGDAGTYLQRFTVAEGPDGEPYETANVVGVLRGTRSDWKDQSIVVGAHYDHLGTGWPDVHSGDEGRIHPGADDNASGVAVLLELARTLAEEGAGSRNLVFVAFGAEEAGKLGSRHYVQSGHPYPVDGLRGAINLDTVGRLRDNPVSVLGTGSADEWQHIFRGCSFVTGVPSRNVPGSYEASDQASFIAAGVPAVQIFTEAHTDYHRPGDTADKIDATGLVKLATFVKEAVSYLVEREEPLAVTIEGAQSEPAPSSARTGRRVRFGTIPDFEYQGPGAKVATVIAGSPAERAGVEAGDVIVRIGETEIVSLQAYADVLKVLEPGQTVTTVVRRGDERVELEVTAEAR